jgi:sec-independent protein translocase protein TatC
MSGPPPETPEREHEAAEQPAIAGEGGGAEPSSEPVTATPSSVDEGYGYYEDPYAYGEAGMAASTAVETPAVSTALEPSPGTSLAPPPPPPPASKDEPEEEEEDGMLRMSFLEHLEELRSRIIKLLAGVGVAFVVSLTFTQQLWLLVSEPAVTALKDLGYKQTSLTAITPMEQFNTIWIKLPILAAVFMASPWVLYQVWAFIAPGLYKRERNWATPFILCSAGLFILGGIFAYTVVFRFGLVFLLGIGRDINVVPMVSITEYFDLFVNVILGVALVFELPILIFFLTLLRIVSPSFLLRNSRYAVLLIVVLAAIITPTPDVFNLMLFATPMCLLFFVGVFASYLLVLHREHRRFPWRMILYTLLVVLLAASGALYIAITKYGYHLVKHWPYLVRQ